MSSLPLLVVIGATGTQGGSVLNHLISLSTSPYRLRGITRNTTSEAAQTLASRGVEMVSANLDDPASLSKAFEGANAIFSVTDFWAPFYTPSSRAAAAAAGKSINEWVYDYELQQGKNVFDAAAKVSTLERLVFSSLADVRKWSGGKYTQVWHFDGKAHAEEYARKTHPELWKMTSVLQVGWYLSNWLMHPHLAPKKDQNGVLVFAGMMSGDLPLPLIATELDTGPLAYALLQEPPGKNLVGYREMMSMDEYIRIFEKVTGAKAERKTMTLEETVANMPEELGQEVAEAMAFAKEYGYAGEKVDKSVIGFEQVSLHLRYRVFANNWT